MVWFERKGGIHLGAVRSEGPKKVTLVDERGETLSPERRAILRTILTDYGQRGEVTAALLKQISTPALDLRVVVHGHDVDFAGWYREGGNQACPVLFGAAPDKRRFLLVVLAGCAAGDGHGRNRVDGPGKRPNRLAVVGLPKTHRLVGPAGEQHGSVGRKGDTAHRAGMPGKDA